MIIDSLKELEQLITPSLNLDKPMSPKEKSVRASHASIESKNNLNVQLDKKLIEVAEKCSQILEQDEMQEIQDMLRVILDDPKKFYKLNNIINISPYSPFSKLEMSKTEKYIEGTQNVIKKWTKQLKDINKHNFAYTKAVETFANQLLVDKNFFGQNIEIQSLLMLIAQMLTEQAMYLEEFAETAENSIRK